MPQPNLIKLQCTECKRINYYSKKNKKKLQEKLELKKYCKWDKKRTPHKEMKK
ncbi:50S ribosomal protein L33 [Patescibacteria group bacterium]